MLCKICGKENCDRHGFFIGKPVKLEQFSGSSPPEVFIGRWGYPRVYTGILSPPEYGDTAVLTSAELWHARKLGIQEILAQRQKLIYGRTQQSIKQLGTKFLGVLKEVAMTHKPIAAEFQLKKGILPHKEQASNVPLIPRAAEVKHVKLQENPEVHKKVDYLVQDTDALAQTALLELDKTGLQTSLLSKLLSAGLLGQGFRRKLVPTRWSITAVDDMLSKDKLKRIRFFPELNEICVFNAEYVGNHYEFLLLPGVWSFEVIELSNHGVWHDYETHFPRKNYADEVTGAYYANRLAVTEYLEKIGKQAVCLVFREVRAEYSAPLGVGILRQTSREAFSKPPEKFSTLNEAYASIRSRLRFPLDSFLGKSVLLQDYGKQKKLQDFF